MAWIALATAALASNAVTADFGGTKAVNLGTAYNRYDFALTNDGSDPAEVKACPKDIEISLHTHRVERIPAFALGLADPEWAWTCQTHRLAPGETVMLYAYFKEWWHSERTFGAYHKEVRAVTSAGDFTLRFSSTGTPGRMKLAVRNLPAPSSGS